MGSTPISQPTTTSSATTQQEVQALLTDLKLCSRRRALQWGREIHARAVDGGTDSNLQVATAIIRMYAKCGSMVDARRVFDSIQEPELMPWNAILMGYADNGKAHVTLELFSQMKTRECVPDSVTYIAALKACSSLAVHGDGAAKAQSLELGRSIHSEIGFISDLYLQTTLIDLYATCRNMADAWKVFDRIEKPSVVSWNALLLGYAENGEGDTALELFSKMKTSGCAPDSVTYVAVLKACTSLENGDGLETGRSIHHETGFHLKRLNLYVLNTLIDMYAKCGSMADAREVFDNIKKPSVISWTALLLGYAENGEGHIALDLFSRMKRDCVPDSITYIAVLKACCSIGALDLGRKFHSEIRDFTGNVVTCLVDFYAKCGSMVEAREIFDLHSTARGISTWNALLAGYSTCGDAVSMFSLYEAMQDEGFRPDAVTFLCMLLCCSHSGLAEKAREYFKAMLFCGVTPTLMHYSCMVDTLGRANQLHEAIAVLREMHCSPDATFWMALFGACRKWKNVKIGACVFQSLIDMDRTNASAYVLMAHIYGSLGMWEEQHMVLSQVRSKFAQASGQASVVASREANAVLF